MTHETQARAAMIRWESTDAVGRLTLDRPEKLNALATEMIAGLAQGVAALVDDGVSVIVVRSSGRHFSAGADIGEWATPAATQAQRMSRIGVDAFAALARAPMPTIAVIDGVAAGGGLELALACDLRIATTRARLGLPEAGLGNTPAYGGISRLVELVGPSRARELLFTAELIDGSRAAAIGLVNWVVDSDRLDDAVDGIVASITAADPRAVALTKALTGGAPLDGLLASFTSQTPESRDRKEAFLARHATTSPASRDRATD